MSSLIDETAFGAFNKERLLKQSVCMKLFVEGKIDEAEKIILELMDFVINSSFPDQLNKMLIYAIVDIFLNTSTFYFSKIEGITIKDSKF
jgi:hypothetical protein